jgi:CRP-like cAMP-binding protein
MFKSYLIFEEGLIQERVFPLEEQLSIGRRPLNDIHLSDPSVSREHAKVYVENDQVIVEDLGSHNGTFVNDERIKKAFLTHGDSVRVGKVNFRYIQERVSQDLESMAATQEIPGSEISVVSDEKGPSRKSRRLIEAIQKVPLFAEVNEEGLATISEAAHLMVFDRGRTVINEGDRGKSVFIILDGKAKIFTHDHSGQELTLAYLGENRFFGEMSFLTGAPRSATVQTVEETLLCEISFETMREIIQRWPSIKRTLERYFQDRLRDMEAKKQAAGIRDRRRHPRINEKLQVSLSVASSSRVASQLRGKVFRSLTRDVSISGVRIMVQNRDLLTLPIGCQLRLEIFLPSPWGAIRCLGALKNVAEGKEGQDIGYLGVEFADLSQSPRKKLEQFILG